MVQRGLVVMRHQCRSCAVRDSALCHVLPEATLQRLNAISRRRYVRNGGAIRVDAEDPPVVANVVSGVVRLSKSLPDGRTQIVGLQFPSAFIGWPFITSDSLLVEAATNVELCCYPEAHFEALLGAHPGVRDFLLARASGELEEARNWMLLLGRKTAEERVASLLLLCAEKLREVACEHINSAPRDVVELPLSRTEMAQWLGLTIETVGRMMKRLERAGIITCHSIRTIEIHDLDHLRLRGQRDIA